MESKTVILFSEGLCSCGNKKIGVLNRTWLKYSKVGKLWIILTFLLVIPEFTLFCYNLSVYLQVVSIAVTLVGFKQSGNSLCFNRTTIDNKSTVNCSPETNKNNEEPASRYMAVMSSPSDNILRRYRVQAQQNTEKNTHRELGRLNHSVKDGWTVKIGEKLGRKIQPWTSEDSNLHSRLSKIAATTYMEMFTASDAIRDEENDLNNENLLKDVIDDENTDYLYAIEALKKAAENFGKKYKQCKGGKSTKDCFLNIEDELFDYEKPDDGIVIHDKEEDSPSPDHHPDGPDYSSVTIIKTPIRIGMDLYPLTDIHNNQQQQVMINIMMIINYQILIIILRHSLMMMIKY